jgi:molecular chaperone GrpE (heat shock protein)
MKKNDNEKDLNKKQEDQPSDEVKEDSKKELTLEDKIAGLEAEIYQWKNKYAMMFADMDNLQKKPR